MCRELKLPGLAIGRLVSRSWKLMGEYVCLAAMSLLTVLVGAGRVVARAAMNSQDVRNSEHGTTYRKEMQLVSSRKCSHSERQSVPPGPGAWLYRQHSVSLPPSPAAWCNTRKKESPCAGQVLCCLVGDWLLVL